MVKRAHIGFSSRDELTPPTPGPPERDSAAVVTRGSILNALDPQRGVMGSASRAVTLDKYTLCFDNPIYENRFLAFLIRPLPSRLIPLQAITVIFGSVSLLTSDALRFKYMLSEWDYAANFVYNIGWLTCIALSLLGVWWSGSYMRRGKWKCGYSHEERISEQKRDIMAIITETHKHMDMAVGPGGSVQHKKKGSRLLSSLSMHPGVMHEDLLVLVPWDEKLVTGWACMLAFFGLVCGNRFRCARVGNLIDGLGIEPGQLFCPDELREEEARLRDQGLCYEETLRCTGYASDANLLLALIAMLMYFSTWAQIRFKLFAVLAVWIWGLYTVTTLAFEMSVHENSGYNVGLLTLVVVMTLSSQRAIERSERMYFMRLLRSTEKIVELEAKLFELDNVDAADSGLELVVRNLKNVVNEAQRLAENTEIEQSGMSGHVEAMIATLRVCLKHLANVDKLMEVDLGALLKNDTENINGALSEFIRTQFGSRLTGDNPRERKRGSSISQEGVKKFESRVEFRMVLPGQASSVAPASVSGESDATPGYRSNPGSGHLNPIPADVISTRATALQGLGTSWDWSALKFAKAVPAGSGILDVVAEHLLVPLTSHYSMDCDSKALRKFLRRISVLYGTENPYHNAIHGLEVLHISVFLIRSLMLERLDPDEDEAPKQDQIRWLGVRLAALCHDVAHFGRNNQFCVETRHGVAITYNDVSVLENMHAATTYRTMQEPGCDFLRSWEAEDWKQLRSVIVGVILETDMKKHFELMASFRVRRSNEQFSLDNESDKMQLLKLCVKAGDIGHSCMPWDVHEEWSLRVAEEFFSQGDAEVEMNLAVSPLCDRYQNDLARSQDGFLHFVCRPLFELLSSEDHTGNVETHCLANLDRNRSKWASGYVLRVYENNRIWVQGEQLLASPKGTAPEPEDSHHRGSPGSPPRRGSQSSHEVDFAAAKLQERRQREAFSDRLAGSLSLPPGKGLQSPGIHAERELLDDQGHEDIQEER